MSIPSNPPTKKSIHVFASDFLPFPGCPRTAGAARSMQILDALRGAGHPVTFSMALDTFIAKKNKDRILPSLTKEEIWASENYYEPEVVLNRIQPDIAIHCNINAFRTVSRFEKDVIHIVDFNGPTHFEGLFMDAPDQRTAMNDGTLLEECCARTVQRIRDIDYVVTVSERQKYFWSAYCTLAGFSFSDLSVLVCPSVYSCAPFSRSPTPQLTVVYSGGFYPWQNPDRFLRATAEILDGIEGATLHVFGEPHAGLPNEMQVKRMLEEIQEHRSVKYHGYRPAEEIMAALSGAWCALEVMEENLERELAVTGRTLEFLASGTPVIYNNYATLSKLIERYDAGWTLPAADTSALHSVFEELQRGGLDLVEKLSCNARRLTACEFSADQCMRPLVDLCAGPLRKRSKTALRTLRSSPPATESLGRVLAISRGEGSLGELRVGNPLRALQRQAYIDGMSIVSPSAHELKDDRNHYDAILVQRAVPEYICETLHNLALPFTLECDDNILARAAYRDYGAEPAMLFGLRHCSVLTAPNPRLIRGLEKYSGMRLTGKAFITPNALPFPRSVSLRTPRQPSQILWIQSEIAALDNSRDAVVRAVDDFSQKYALPVVLIGRSVLRRREFKNEVFMGEIDFTSNLQLLEFAPPSLGVAPLETNADEETLDFIAGKSDLKMLLFAGYGHAGVYSCSPPYSDSALQHSLSTSGNSYEEWTEALEYQYREGWKEMPKIAERIQAERHIDVVARESWRPAIGACILPKPVRGSDLYQAFTEAMRMDRSPIRSLGYLMANWDVARQYVTCDGRTAWKHYAKYGYKEQRHGRHAPEMHAKLLEKIREESAECLARSKEKIRQQHTLIDSLRQKIGTAEAQQDSLRSELGSLQQEVGRLEGELSGAHRTLTGIANSRSWKLTAPLRKLTGLLRKP